MHDAVVDRKGRSLAPEEAEAKHDMGPRTRLKVRTRGAR
jgi:hypothetical protein